MTTTETDIDLGEIEWEREPCRTRDSTNNYTDTLGQIEGTDTWVYYRSIPTPDGISRTLLEKGLISMDGVDLDTDVIAETIEDRAESMHSGGEHPDLDPILELLAANAEQLAKDLVEEWQFGAEEVVGDAIYEGYAGVNNRRAWVGHVDEAVTFEAGEVLRSLLREHGLDRSDNREESDVLVDALYAGIDERRDSWLRPHLEYEVNLSFEAEI